MTNELLRSREQHDTASPPMGSGRGVSVTWWYTVVSAASFSAALLFIWFVPLLLVDASPLRIVGYLGGSVAWMTVAGVCGLGYRRRDRDASIGLSGRGIGLACIGVAAAVTGLASESVTLGLSMAFVLLVTLPWQRGVRARITGLCTVILAVVAGLEGRRLAEPLVDTSLEGWVIPLAFAVILPVSVVSMLWWWDIVRELDRARAAEGRLAAAQERLMLAGDVHDLQGHHLQVIALQLELAERLIRSDPDRALDQLRAAQSSVDDARAGTRELATRFRSVSLTDELQNAADLLRSAGLGVEVEIAGNTDAAPAEVLGPVVRESTTNILKHGGGASARLSLVGVGRGWRFSAVNDVAVDTDPPPTSAHGSGRDGTGISGMRDRVERAGGTLAIDERSGSFECSAVIPVGEES